MALHLLSSMPAARIARNQFSMSAGISACEKAGEWEQALWVLAETPVVAVAFSEILWAANLVAE